MPGFDWPTDGPGLDSDQMLCSAQSLELSVTVAMKNANNRASQLTIVSQGRSTLPIVATALLNCHVWHTCNWHEPSISSYESSCEENEICDHICANASRKAGMKT